MADEKRGETFVMRGEGQAAPAESPLEFTTFVLGLASNTLIHLGASENPETHRTEVDLVLARRSLDLLSMLKEKTRGNLKAEEHKLFDSLLADLRLRYVEATRR